MRCIFVICAAAISATAQPVPEFEVATIRLANSEQGFINSSTPSLNVDGERILKFTQITLRDLIMLAHGVGAPQVQGPAFLNGIPSAPADRFDVAAKVPAGTTTAQVPLMLRALLAERFHLSFHRENKPTQIFALEVSKGGMKMKASPEGANGEARCTRSLAQRDGATLAADCTRMTSVDIAQQVQALAPGYFREGPVVDQTGLKGTYDFKLEWITAIQAANGDSGPTMFAAARDQLGLTLEKRQEPVEILVIDKLDRMPTEN